MTYNGDRLHDMQHMPVKRDYLVWVGLPSDQLDFGELMAFLEWQEISVRTFNCIKNGYDSLAHKYGDGSGRLTLQQARGIPDHGWMRIPNLGPKTLAELRRVIPRFA